MRATPNISPHAATTSPESLSIFLSTIAIVLIRYLQRCVDERRESGMLKPSLCGRLVLRFQDGSFKDPFIARYVSDGTVKMFAYLVLLYDPHPHRLLAVEEPENQLYPHLLPELTEEFRNYAQRGSQVFVSTHSPDFLNDAELDEVVFWAKRNGFAVAQRVSDARPAYARGRGRSSGSAMARACSPPSKQNETRHFFA